MCFLIVKRRNIKGKILILCCFCQFNYELKIESGKWKVMK